MLSFRQAIGPIVFYFLRSGSVTGEHDGASRWRVARSLATALLASVFRHHRQQQLQYQPSHPSLFNSRRILAFPVIALWLS